MSVYEAKEVGVLRSYFGCLRPSMAHSRTMVFRCVAHEHPSSERRVWFTSQSCPSSCIHRPQMYCTRIFHYWALAEIRYTYAFWAINTYTSHCTPGTSSWRRLIVGLLSIVPSNRSKGQGKPTIIYSTSVSHTCGFDCDISCSNDHFFATEI